MAFVAGTKEIKLKWGDWLLVPCRVVGIKNETGDKPEAATIWIEPAEQLLHEPSIAMRAEIHFDVDKNGSVIFDKEQVELCVNPLNWYAPFLKCRLKGRDY